MKKRKSPLTDPIRFSPSPDAGLSSEQVQSRRDAALTNYIKKSTTKPVFRIFLDNICTYFNLIWAIIITTIICLGEYDQLFFVMVIFANTAIAIILELHAKYTLDRLSLVTAPKIDTLRNGEHVLLHSDDIVLDDIIVLEAGAQVPADAVLIDGNVEMNESMLTGESDAIKKQPGDTLFAGSYIISGACRARIDKVGGDSYIQKIAARVKTFKAPNSFLFRDINRIIKYIGIFILPFSVVMYFNNVRDADVRQALLNTAGSLQGMIPAGMFLLITIAFSLGVVKLAVRHTQVKDTYSIEMLARTNMLCLDKTGTITDGTMRVVKDEDLSDGRVPDAPNIIANIMAAQDSGNFTSDALLRHYTVSEPLQVLYNIPFSSKRKFTATVFAGRGTFAIGAPEFLSVAHIPDDVLERIHTCASQGQRVLMLAGSDTCTQEDTLPDDMQPIALIMLEDHIREEAPGTIAWFVENGVKIRIISGDNPVTVAAIAKRVGVAGAENYVSLEGMSSEQAAELADDYTVFGRVTPDQKLALVRKLRALGYVVAMTGDGINDTMALKEADCSIAMADGSAVARGLSNIVLLDNNFATLPAVVREGRQVVNNVQRSSTLFLMKTFFTITLSLCCVCMMVRYPFEPNSLFIFETFVTGLPSVILALQPNSNPIRGRFISHVLRKCIPDGMVILLSVLGAMLVASLLHMNDTEELSLLSLVLTFSGFVNLVFLCLPINRYRLGCIALSLIGITATLLLAGKSFGVSSFTPAILWITLAFVIAGIPLHLLFSWIYSLIFHRKKKKKTA